MGATTSANGLKMARYMLSAPAAQRSFSPLNIEITHRVVTAKSPAFRVMGFRLPTRMLPQGLYVDRPGVISKDLCFEFC